MTLLLLALACSSEAPPPAAAPPSPAAEPPPPAPAPAPQPAAGQPWAIDSAATTVTASAHKVIGGHDLGFSGATGVAMVNGEALTGVEVAVPMSGLVADPEKLRTHLLTADFFDAAQFPEAKFHSTQVTGAAPAYTVTGTFVLHGAEKEVTFPVTGSVAAGVFTGTAEIVLDRKDFGLVYPGKPDNLIQDNVELHVKLVAKAP